MAAVEYAKKAYVDGSRYAAFNRSSLGTSSPLLVVCNDKGQPPDLEIYPLNQTEFATMPGKFYCALIEICKH
jgi:hypothetical protein